MFYQWFPTPISKLFFFIGLIFIGLLSLEIFSQIQYNLRHVTNVPPEAKKWREPSAVKEWVSPDSGLEIRLVQYGDDPNLNEERTFFAYRHKGMKEWKTLFICKPADSLACFFSDEEISKSVSVRFPTKTGAIVDSQQYGIRYFAETKDSGIHWKLSVTTTKELDSEVSK